VSDSPTKQGGGWNNQDGGWSQAGGWNGKPDDGWYGKPAIDNGWDDNEPAYIYHVAYGSKGGKKGGYLGGKGSKGIKGYGAKSSKGSKGDYWKKDSARGSGMGWYSETEYDEGWYGPAEIIDEYGWYGEYLPGHPSESSRSHPNMVPTRKPTGEKTKEERSSGTASESSTTVKNLAFLETEYSNFGASSSQNALASSSPCINKNNFVAVAFISLVTAASIIGSLL